MGLSYVEKDAHVRLENWPNALKNHRDEVICKRDEMREVKADNGRYDRKFVPSSGSSPSDKR